MSKKLFKNKKVLIMGLGLHGGGAANAEFFYKQGAEVLVTDLKPAEKLEESLEKLKKFKIKYTLGRHEKEDFKWPDLIIKNPDVPGSSPYLKIAEAHKIPVETDVSLFFRLSKAFIIGVTGTKGKSTTASLIHHILSQKYKRVFLAGNIGISPLKLLSKMKRGDRVVLELSSFELEGIKQSPSIAVITNIMPDHLNRYGTMEEYLEAKKNIFKYQTNKDFLILNEDDDILRRLHNKCCKISIVRQVSLKNLPKDVDLTGFKLLGKHNLSNLLAAIEVAKILKIKPRIIEKGLSSFKGVPHRQEFIKEVRGVKYFNDTAATMPDAVIAAIKTFKQGFPKSRLVLICGGQNKNLEYKDLANEIKKNVDVIVMLPGSASKKIEEFFGLEKINEACSMEEAVKMSARLAKNGDVVLLSPGAASFNLFKNEFDRGQQFVENVNRLK